MATKKNRGFCITINNFSEEEKDLVKAFIEEKCDIGIAETEHEGERPRFEEEEEEKEWTPHIQGYLHFSTPRRIEFVKRIFRRAHIELAKGTWRDNFKYCSKEGKVFAIKGHTLEEAKNTKATLEEIIADAKILEPVEFEEKHPKAWFLHREKIMRTMIESQALKAKAWDGDFHQKNIWLWGKPGIGKSRWANNLCEIQFIYKKNFNKWWDGFQHFRTKIVILEDYPAAPAGNALAQHMKIWGDRYQFIGENKGSHISIEPGRFFLVITSNYSITQAFNNEDDIKAIQRRFNEVEMTEENSTMINALSVDFDLLNKTIVNL